MATEDLDLDLVNFIRMLLSTLQHADGKEHLEFLIMLRDAFLGCYLLVYICLNHII